MLIVVLSLIKLFQGVNLSLTKKREKPEDFIGWKSPDGKLEVVGIVGKDKWSVALFKVTCTDCSKDKELFPDGYFVITKSNLVRGRKPCGCSKSPKWEEWQYLILARRVGEKKGFIVHSFAEEFHDRYTKLNLECLKDGHKWTASIDNIINGGTPKCAGVNLSEQKKTPAYIALQKCINICEEMNYGVVGFVDGYKGVHKTRFEYNCKIHGKQNVSYNTFINMGAAVKAAIKIDKKN